MRGWDSERVILLFAILATASGTALGLFANARRIGELIGDGQLDAALALPVEPLPYLLTRRIDTVLLGDLLFGPTLFLVAGHPTPERALVFVVSSALAAVVLVGFLVFAGSLTFFIGGRGAQSDIAFQAVLPALLLPARRVRRRHPAAAVHRDPGGVRHRPAGAPGRLVRPRRGRRPRRRGRADGAARRDRLPARPAPLRLGGRVHARVVSSVAMSSRRPMAGTTGAPLTKDTPREAFDDVLTRLGYELGAPDSERAWSDFRSLAGRKSLVTTHDLEALLDDRLRAQAEQYQLVRMSIRTTTEEPAHARVELLERNNEATAVAEATGDGPVDAAFNAIREALSVDAELVRFSIDALSGGTDALADAHVVVSLDGETFAGEGIAPDITEAAVRAYLRALSHERRVSRGWTA